MELHLDYSLQSGIAVPSNVLVVEQCREKPSGIGYSPNVFRFFLTGSEYLGLILCQAYAMTVAKRAHSPPLLWSDEIAGTARDSDRWAGQSACELCDIATP